MSKGLVGADPCADQNMIAVSNPCKLDSTLAPPGTIVLHAYGCGNEPYEGWQVDISSSYKERQSTRSSDYAALKEQRGLVLWRAVEQIIPDARDRVLIDLVGSPLTHERFLRRPRGTYGATFATVLPDVLTPVAGLVLCGDSVFPGIGVPAVAVNGASAANTLVNPIKHWLKMDELESRGLL